MLKRVYYFEPCLLAPVLRQLPGASRSGRPSRSKRTGPERYQVIPIDRKGGERPQWELPAVIIADAGEDELEGIEKIAPEEGVCLPSRARAPRGHRKGAGARFREPPARGGAEASASRAQPGRR